MSSASSLDKATTNLVDAVFTSLDNEETAQESIVDVQNSDAVINDCNMVSEVKEQLNILKAQQFTLLNIIINNNSS